MKKVIVAVVVSLVLAMVGSGLIIEATGNQLTPTTAPTPPGWTWDDAVKVATPLAMGFFDGN